MRPAAVFVVCAMLGAWPAASGGKPAPVQPPRAALTTVALDSLPLLITSNEVVVEGTVLSSHLNLRVLRGGCTNPGYRPTWLLDTDVLVSRTIAGTCTADTVRLSSLGDIQYGLQVPAPGTPILAFGRYDCSDALSITGWYA